MMTKFLRSGVLVAGVVFAFASMVACSDDSTASAPITSNPVTTSPTSGSSESSAAASSADESSTDAPVDSTSSAQNTPTTGGSSLPATAPRVTTQASSDTGPNGAPLDAKAKKYLAALRSQNVTLLGDSDNSVALTLAVYVCDAQKKNTDPVTTKGYVTALVAAGTKTAQEANTKADKVIKAAQENYC